MNVTTLPGKIRNSYSISLQYLCLHLHILNGKTFSGSVWKVIINLLNISFIEGVLIAIRSITDEVYIF